MLRQLKKHIFFIIIFSSLSVFKKNIFEYTSESNSVKSNSQVEKTQHIFKSTSTSRQFARS
jgi:hypothetical protein